MELNWSTFLLEILNFLVLVWILKRFLYRPVLDLIARRRERIEQTLVEARREQKVGKDLQHQYESRLEDWEHEKAMALGALQRELADMRRQRLEALDAELADQREKDRVLAQQERHELERRLESRAMALGANFAARLLERVAAADLEKRLVAMALEDMAAITQEQRKSLTRALHENDAQAEVISAYTLDDGQRQALQTALADLAGFEVNCRCREDPTLIAGLRMKLGSWVLHANLRDELKGFAEAGHG